MGMGLIGESVLGDIANAIREQNGTATTYKPLEMAAAVAALDGTSGGNATTATLGTGTGVIGEAVFSAIADAIRGQNGLTTKYKPGEMAQAIRDLVWDTGLKPRALLLSDGTLELNYLDGRQVKSGSGKVLSAWEVPATSFSSMTDRPWDGVRGDVTRVYVHASFATAVSELGIADISFWFASMPSLLEVEGFQNLSGITTAKQAFASCGELRTIWATSFDTSAVTGAYMAFYACPQLVGGGLAVSSGSSGTGAAGFTVGGSKGLLTDPSDDARAWAYGWLYADGELVVTATSSADPSRELLCGGSFVANARHNALGGLPWHDQRSKIASVTFADDMAGLTGVCLDYWLYNLSASTLAFSGWANVHATSLSFFLNGSLNLATLDLTDLDPSGILYWNYALSGMSALTTIYVDSDWELPSSISNKTATFYGDKALVGGNGTAFDSSKTSADMAVVDKEGQEGYLTASS